ncbi:MAG: hypothetical protein JWR19_105 [Pedosphaera sp.]|nr:hypothetical protein [Pedosphaera sp.]
METGTGKAAGNYELKSELAKLCLPAGRDNDRKLAWVNSICILFLLIGVLGAKSPDTRLKALPQMEEPIPVIIEPTPPPASQDEPRKEEETPPEQKETPQVVVVTPETPAINFAVPTVGNLVVPLGIAKAPPLKPMAPIEPARSVPTTLNNTGNGGDRPAPPYPKIALEQGQEGSVVLALTVDDGGVIVEIQVKESSGSGVLDRSALEFVKRHWIIPPGNRTRVYEAPITFKLIK